MSSIAYIKDLSDSCYFPSSPIPVDLDDRETLTQCSWQELLEDTVGSQIPCYVLGLVALAPVTKKDSVDHRWYDGRSLRKLLLLNPEGTDPCTRREIEAVKYFPFFPASQPTATCQYESAGSQDGDLVDLIDLASNSLPSSMKFKAACLTTDAFFQSAQEPTLTPSLSEKLDEAARSWLRYSERLNEATSTPDKQDSIINFLKKKL
jgi:hypothetical protein